MIMSTADIGPHNARLNTEGEVIFIDLDDKCITKDEIDMIWNGAIYMHIAYMQCYGSDAVDTLWKILKFGIAQKEQMYEMCR